MKDFWQAYLKTFDKNMNPVSSNAIKSEKVGIAKYLDIKDYQDPKPTVQPFTGFFSRFSDNSEHK
jgi:hypothetical protein